MSTRDQQDAVTLQIELILIVANTCLEGECENGEATLQVAMSAMEYLLKTMLLPGYCLLPSERARWQQVNVQFADLQQYLDGQAFTEEWMEAFLEFRRNLLMTLPMCQ